MISADVDSDPGEGIVVAYDESKGGRSMRRRVAGFTGTALLLMFALASPLAHATDVEIFRADYNNAQATFNTMNGCILQQARIAAENALEHVGPVVVRDDTILFVEVGEYDTCDNFRALYRRSARSEVPVDVFFVDPALSTARVVVDFTVCNMFPNDGQCRILSIDLAWEPVATVDNETITHHSRLNPPETQAEHQTLRSRPTNVVGSITDGVTEYASTATTGSITTQHEGIVSVTPGN